MWVARVVTYLELVRFLQEVSDRLGEFFDIGLPVVTNVLAGSERELKGYKWVPIA